MPPELKSQQQKCDSVWPIILRIDAFLTDFGQPSSVHHFQNFMSTLVFNPDTYLNILGSEYMKVLHGLVGLRKTIHLHLIGGNLLSWQGLPFSMALRSGVSST